QCRSRECLVRSDGAATARRARAGDLPARPADAGRARRLSKGRDREVVADHQGGRHQGRIDALAIRLWLRVNESTSQCEALLRLDVRFLDDAGVLFDLLTQMGGKTLAAGADGKQHQTAELFLDLR